MVEGKELVEKNLDWQYGLQQDRYQVEGRGKFKIVGFWAVVPAQSSTQVEVIYDSLASRQVLVKHQPGIGSFDYKLMVNGKLMLNSVIDQKHEFCVK